MYKCKRCGRVLTSRKSIELGYGKVCYRIHLLEEANKSEPEVNQEIAFLKMEIKTLKRMIKNIQVRGTTVESIKRIRKDVESIPSIIKEGFADVVKEMKSIFKENFYYKDYLKPVNPIEEPVDPPVLIRVLA